MHVGGQKTLGLFDQLIWVGDLGFVTAYWKQLERGEAVYVFICLHGIRELPSGMVLVVRCSGCGTGGG